MLARRPGRLRRPRRARPRRGLAGRGPVLPAPPRPCRGRCRAEQVGVLPTPWGDVPVWRLDGHGGGIWVAVRDRGSGRLSPPAGRVLYDTALRRRPRHRPGRRARRRPQLPARARQRPRPAPRRPELPPEEVLDVVVPVGELLPAPPPGKERGKGRTAVPRRGGRHASRSAEQRDALGDVRPPRRRGTGRRRDGPGERDGRSRGTGGGGGTSAARSARRSAARCSRPHAPPLDGPAAARSVLSRHRDPSGPAAAALGSGRAGSPGSAPAAGARPRRAAPCRAARARRGRPPRRSR